MFNGLVIFLIGILIIVLSINICAIRDVNKELIKIDEQLWRNYIAMIAVLDLKVNLKVDENGTVTRKAKEV